METHANTLILIRVAFPGRDELIERGWSENPTFRGLCEGYLECAAALDRWHQLSGVEARSRRQERAELLAGLGQEIQSRLEAMVNRYFRCRASSR